MKKVKIMKKNQPEMHEIAARCIGCGNSFPIYSTQTQVTTELCSHCHPFFTGEQKYVDTAGRIEKFERKYKKQESAQGKKEQGSKEQNAKAK